MFRYEESEIAEKVSMFRQMLMEKDADAGDAATVLVDDAGRPM